MTATMTMEAIEKMEKDVETMGLREFFREWGGTPVRRADGKIRWRFPHALVWWDAGQDWWHVKGRGGWKVRAWGRLVDEEIVEEFGVRAWSRAVRLALWNMAKP